jgi:predicted HicB family RNase H-like nuclease
MGKQTKWSNDYVAKAYDRLAVFVPKGRRTEIQALAAAQGKSLNQYVVDAIEAMESKSEDVSNDREKQVL